MSQRHSPALWSRSAAPEAEHTVQALGSAQLRCVSVGRGICQAQTLVQLCTATQMPLLQFKSKPYVPAERFNQGKSQGNVLLPLPSPSLDCCVCKISERSYLLDSLNPWPPFPPLCSNPQSSGAQLTFVTLFPYQTRGSMGISSHHLHRFKKQTRSHSTFMFPP